MMKNVLRTSVIQFCPVLGKIDENIRQIEEMFKNIPDSDLIVLPELASSGYNFLDFQQAMSCSEESGNSRFIDFLQEKSLKSGAFIISGFNERDGAMLYNSAVMVGPEGLAGKYRKTHLFVNEKDIFQPGNAGLPVFDINGCKIGILICFDYLFPEIWRMLAMKGCDVICHPSNLLTENAHICVPGLAIMNKIFIVTANRIGTEGTVRFNGMSFITDPSGKVIAELSEENAGIMHAELDYMQARNKWITSRNHVFNDRRPEIYS